VKILTGDSELVAAKVCHEVGLDAGDVVVGSDIETSPMTSWRRWPSAPRCLPA
jgi:magnesium-transporting ATPase (P-type)